MRNVIFLLNFLLISAFTYADEPLKIAVDLGGNKFHYLEMLFAKIIVNNISGEALEMPKVEDYDGPLVTFELYDKQLNKILPDRTPCCDGFDRDKTYIIDPGEQIEFPLCSYYLLQYYMIGSNGIIYPYLKPGNYKIRAILSLKKKKITSDWLDFVVTDDHYAGLEQYININKNYDINKDYKEYEKQYFQILQYDSISVLSIRIIFSIQFLYNGFYKADFSYRTQKQYLALKKAEKLFLNHFPESRFAYYTVRSIIGNISSSYLKEYAYDRLTLMEQFMKKIKTPEFKRVLGNNIRIRKNTFSQPGLQIIEKNSNSKQRNIR